MPTSSGRPSPGEVTRLLAAWQGGDDAARDRLMPVVYDDLRRRAAGHLRRRGGQTLRPTELVHETYLRLCEQDAAWRNREQFFGVASSLMRRILVDHARARAAAKRGGGRVTVVAVEPSTPGADPDLLDLDAALDQLAALDERQARLVELRYFGGLTLEETAAVLHISLATAKREWVSARAWLYRRLKTPGPGG